MDLFCFFMGSFYFVCGLLLFCSFGGLQLFSGFGLCVVVASVFSNKSGCGNRSSFHGRLI